MRTTIGIAIDIPEPWGGELTKARAEAGDPQAAYVPAHVTLLGPTEIEAADLAVIERRLAEIAAARPPFTLHLRGTGTFRPITEVVFVAVAAGISECEQLNAAIQDIDVIDRANKFPYHPHVTVAQDVPSAQLDAVFRNLAGFEARFPVKGFTLFEHGSGGRWRQHRDYVLGSADDPADNGR
ncbi:2'-5' RNA ligase family protein [Planosporangium flavigriseum]|uniref:Phosphoesterase n=1 Tax=Planosporangium flavigriseum TaxID=373681 RepID=A0A8J3PJV6_9ACTN|nr:2'-5' RNA ligase family protein [Planosporangium flavigriseum]NJC63515.1 2'-5' RNA ligase family protein [Planosporangium flavigriseum]GIG72212.1 phosphoesterase [Planosporangium flavigriseum]